MTPTENHPHLLEEVRKDPHGNTKAIMERTGWSRKYVRKLINDDVIDLELQEFEEKQNRGRDTDPLPKGEYTPKVTDRYPRRRKIGQKTSF